MSTTMKLGPLDIQSKAILAPMAGYTDSAMRTLCLDAGAGMVYTEVVSADGLARQIPVTLFMLESVPEERPLVGHIFGTDPSVMAEAARMIEATGRFDAIDINSGCPVRKVVCRGAGAALMRDPDLLGRIVRAVRDAVRLPVMVKTRIGWCPESHNVERLARIFEDAGADVLAVHARYASARHGGPADWDALRRLKEGMRIPLIGNGGIHSGEDARRMLDETGVDAVMVGRGAVGQPWIFAEIQAVLEGRPFVPPSSAERLAWIRTHLERLCRLVELSHRVRRPGRYNVEEATCLKFRGFLMRYLSGYHGVKYLMMNMHKIHTVEGLLNAVSRFMTDEGVDLVHDREPELQELEE